MRRYTRMGGKNAALCLALSLLSSCVCPGHLGTRTVPISALQAEPKIGLDYMGSDSAYHYFLRRNCYSLFSLGEWSVTDRFRVRKDEVRARREFELTRQREAWIHYYLAEPSSLAKFGNDFAPNRREGNSF